MGKKPSTATKYSEGTHRILLGFILPDIPAEPDNKKNI